MHCHPTWRWRCPGTASNCAQQRFLGHFVRRALHVCVNFHGKRVTSGWSSSTQIFAANEARSPFVRMRRPLRQVYGSIIATWCDCQLTDTYILIRTHSQPDLILTRGIFLTDTYRSRRTYTYRTLSLPPPQKKINRNKRMDSLRKKGTNPESLARQAGYKYHSRFEIEANFPRD